MKPRSEWAAGLRNDGNLKFYLSFPYDMFLPFSPARSRSTRIACSRAPSSSEPKPSSINIISRCTAPAVRCTISESPSAIESAAIKASPPDKVFTSRTVSVTRLYTERSSPRFCSFPRSRCPLTLRQTVPAT